MSASQSYWHSERITVSAGLKIAHCIGIKLIRLEENGSFLAVENVDSGGSGAQRDTGDCDN